MPTRPAGQHPYFFPVYLFLKALLPSRPQTPVDQVHQPCQPTNKVGVNAVTLHNSHSTFVLKRVNKIRKSIVASNNIRIGVLRAPHFQPIVQSMSDVVAEAHYAHQSASACMCNALFGRTAYVHESQGRTVPRHIGTHKESGALEVYDLFFS